MFGINWDKEQKAAMGVIVGLIGLSWWYGKGHPYEYAAEVSCQHQVGFDYQCSECDACLDCCTCYPLCEECGFPVDPDNERYEVGEECICDLKEEDFGAVVAPQLDETLTPVKKAMIGKWMLDRSDMEHTMLQIESAVRLGLIREEDAVRALSQLQAESEVDRRSRKGQVRYMGGAPRRPRKLVKDRDITAHDAARKVRLEAESEPSSIMMANTHWDLLTPQSRIMFIEDYTPEMNYRTRLAMGGSKIPQNIRELSRTLGMSQRETTQKLITYSLAYGWLTDGAARIMRKQLNHDFDNYGSDYEPSDGEPREDMQAESRCGVCSQKGHNRRTCPRNTEDVQVSGRRKVGNKVVEECVDLRATKADATANYYRVRFREPKSFVNFRVPEWASRAANTIGLKYYDVRGSKITMGQTSDGEWRIQSVMVPRLSSVDAKKALRIANHIQDRIEKEGEWAPKRCKDQERVLRV